MWQACNDLRACIGSSSTEIIHPPKSTLKNEKNCSFNAHYFHGYAAQSRSLYMTEQKVLDSRLYFDKNPLVLEVLESLPKTVWKHLLMWSNICSCLTHLSNLWRLENCPAVNTRREPVYSTLPGLYRNKLFVLHQPAPIRQMGDPSTRCNLKFF